MFESIQQQTLDVLSAIIEHLPNVLGAIVLLFAGWLLARFLQMVITRLVRSLNTLLGKQLHGSARHLVRISGATERLLGVVVFWSTMLVFVSIAVGLIGFSAAAVWLDRLVVFVPSLVSGALIIIISFIVGTIARHLVQHAASAADITRAALFGQIAQVSFLIVGVVTGLGQIGVDVSFLVILLAIAFAAVLAGFSLAFGLGAQSLVQNLIAVRHLKQVVRQGQIVEINGDRGRVLEL